METKFPKTSAQAIKMIEKAALSATHPNTSREDALEVFRISRIIERKTVIDSYRAALEAMDIEAFME